MIINENISGITLEYTAKKKKHKHKKTWTECK